MLQENKQGELLNTIPPADKQRAYLEHITATALERTQKICVNAGVTPETQHILFDSIKEFASKTDTITLLDHETVIERTKRVGWMIQAVALENLGELEGLSNNTQRGLWKDVLMVEILTARKEKNHVR